MGMCHAMVNAPEVGEQGYGALIDTTEHECPADSEAIVDQEEDG